MTDANPEYFAALERLKKRNAKINNDTVALEAGRKKGSIKKSRSQCATLIAAIDLANKETSTPQHEAAERLARAKSNETSLQSKLDAALARELSLVVEVFELRKQLATLRGGTVIPIRENSGSSQGKP